MPEGYGRYVLFQKEGKTVAAAYAMEPELAESGAAARWESFIATKAVDELCTRAQELGATIVTEAFDMPGVARMAVLADPEGAAFTLYQAAGEIGTQLLNEPGAPCWFELYARDLAQSTSFYAELFGYELRNATGLGGAPYVQLGIGKGAAGGAMQLRPEWGEMPPMWAVYFQTDDLDAAIARAESHGGDLLMAASEVPGVGRFAMLCDPQGASFMVMQMGAVASKPAKVEEPVAAQLDAEELDTEELDTEEHLADEAIADTNDEDHFGDLEADQAEEEAGDDMDIAGQVEAGLNADATDDDDPLANAT